MEPQVVVSLDELLVVQSRVISRAQLQARGIDDYTMTRRVSKGEWQRPVPGVYALVTAGLSTEQRRVAAALYAGDGAQLTGPSALHWYGFRYVPATDRVHVLVPHENHRRSAGPVVVRRTLELDPEARDVGLYRLASPARAVVDTSRFVGGVEATEAIFAEAVQSRFTDVAKIEAELRRAKRSRTGIGNRALNELYAGVRSMPEGALRALTRTSTSLGEIMWNPELIDSDGVPLPSPDGYLPATGIALEVDSREHHMTGEGFERTLNRGNVLGRYGVLVLHFTPNEIRRQPARVLRMIEDTHTRRLAHPVPIPITAYPCQ
jgi:hypothetical protein